MRFVGIDVLGAQDRLAFWGLFESDWGDPKTPKPYPIVPMRLNTSGSGELRPFVPFLCPHCRRAVDFTDSDRREKYRDNRTWANGELKLDYYWCPYCDKRFRIVFSPMGLAVLGTVGLDLLGAARPGKTEGLSTEQHQRQGRNRGKSDLPADGKPAKGWSQVQPNKKGPAITPDSKPAKSVAAGQRAVAAGKRTIALANTLSDAAQKLAMAGQKKNNQKAVTIAQHAIVSAQKGAIRGQAAITTGQKATTIVGAPPPFRPKGGSFDPNEWAALQQAIEDAMYASLAAETDANNVSSDLQKQIDDLKKLIEGLKKDLKKGGGPPDGGGGPPGGGDSGLPGEGKASPDDANATLDNAQLPQDPFADGRGGEGQSDPFADASRSSAEPRGEGPPDSSDSGGDSTPDDALDDAQAQEDGDETLRGLDVFGTPIIVSPGDTKALLDTDLAQVRALHNDIAVSSVVDAFKQAWLVFGQEFMTYYNDHTGYFSRFGAAQYQKAEEYRKRIDDWRLKFVQLGGKTTSPTDDPYAKPPDTVEKGMSFLTKITAIAAGGVALYAGARYGLPLLRKNG